MTLGPRARTLLLTAHVTASVGWLGAVAAFLALAIAGLVSADDATVRASYVAMELTTWAVIVPLCGAAMLTGLIQSLGTPWGLFRHWWVVVKLGLTLAATALLLLHTRPIGQAARAAATGPLAPGDLHGVRVQLVVDAAAALALLLVITALGIYKPRGLTPYGWRRRAAQAQTTSIASP